MQSQVENISETKKKIKLSVPANLVEDSYKDAYRVVRKKANIPGFRKGKIPDTVLERHYGGDIEMESLNLLVQNTYGLALDEHKLIPVMKPKFDVKPLARGSAYEYEVELEVKPAFELKDYMGIKVPKKEAEVSDSEVTEELDKMRDTRAELKSAPDGSDLKDGIVASIDFEGTVDGVAFKGGTAKGFMLEYGKGRFLKEFEDQMAGQKTGEERIVNITFPENYDPELAGKKAQFKVKVEALYIKELPALDDEFAKDMGKESLAQIKQEATDHLKARKERAFRNDYAEVIVETLLKNHKFEIPQGLVEEEKKNSQKSEDEIKKSIKLQFILESIAEKESMKVNPQDIEMRFKQLSMIYRQPVDVLKQYYQQNNLISGLIAQVVTEKTLDLLVDKANLV